MQRLQIFDYRGDLGVREDPFLRRHDGGEAFYDIGRGVEQGFPEVCIVRRDLAFFAVCQHRDPMAGDSLQGRPCLGRAVYAVAGAAAFFREELRSVGT